MRGWRLRRMNHRRRKLELSIDRAVPLGLVLNEIATNSIKHAFGPDRGGRISVKLVAGVGYGEARLSVADNGRGIKEHNPKGSGLKLIAALARQIGGTVDQDSSNKGTTTWLIFPVVTGRPLPAAHGAQVVDY
jgi:two-component sensor histidine kinase